MSGAAIAIVVGINLGLIYLLMAAPLGRWTLKVARRVAAPPVRLRDALWPLGRHAGWSGEILSARSEGDGLVRLEFSWEGRDGRPIERLARIEEEPGGRRFRLAVVDDSSLDGDFWAHYSEETSIVPEGAGTLVEIAQTDRYRGLAFLAFRYFRLRRTVDNLKRWAETGDKPARGIFEHPLTQVGFAVVSALLLWALFGFTAPGLLIAVVLTIVVALHELGHLAAFRLMGHRRVRMIFVPVLGGIAIGGRPYDSRFEVAFVALMGAGFSAFLVPLLIAASSLVASAGNVRAAAGIAVFAGVLALFNLANLVPVWRFDGGQVLRQICAGRATLLVSSFALLAAFMLVALAAGFEGRVVLVAGAVFAMLSLITTGRNVRPRHALKPVGRLDALALGAALVAAFVIHSAALIWLAERYPLKSFAAVTAVSASVAERDALAARIGAALEPAARQEAHAAQA